MTVEDLLEVLARSTDDMSVALTPRDPLVQGFEMTDWHRGFVRNVAQHVAAGRTLSTEQARIILSLCRTFHDDLVATGEVTHTDLDALLASPTYRQPPYLSSRIPREVRHVGDNLLAFRFKFDDVIIREFKLLGERCFGPKPVFYAELRVWLVPVTRHTLRAIQRIIRRDRFGMDDATRKYMTLATRSLNQPSTFVLDEESGIIVGNVCDNEMLASWMRNVANAMLI